ncbi:response regulator transcription factor [Streptomyces sp. NPDC098077]|uniref:helix-turn-helix transcriptional regulator n=1 Tax=Streptomyces sp. NPDC098077 TaxID=3366093 RepID=UPI003815FC8F
MEPGSCRSTRHSWGSGQAGRAAVGRPARARGGTGPTPRAASTPSDRPATSVAPSSPGTAPHTGYGIPAFRDHLALSTRHPPRTHLRPQRLPLSLQWACLPPGLGPPFGADRARDCPFDHGGKETRMAARISERTRLLTGQQTERVENGTTRAPQGRVTADRRGEPASEKSLLGALTPRQLEVLVLLTEGMTNRRIARALGITEKTVKNHMQAIFARLNVSDRTQAAVYMVRYSRTA